MVLKLIDKDDYDGNKVDEAPEEREAYDGPERRTTQRRNVQDRRAMVRFELGKEDRRNVHERRHTDNVWDKGHVMF